jgi:NADPH2:quinone reductase
MRMQRVSSLQRRRATLAWWSEQVSRKVRHFTPLPSASIPFFADRKLTFSLSLTGDWVLVHAAAGGVGLAAVQIAKAFGATVVATAGTSHKLDVARSFGADYAVSYRDKDWPEQVKKLTPKGRGVDIVYDPVGLIAQSMKCTAWNGRLLVIGFAAGDIEKMATNRILLKNVSVVGLHWGAYAINEPEMQDKVWDGIFQLVKEGKYRGTAFTDTEYVGLESVPAALKALGGRDSWGKVVVKVPQEGGSKL